MIAIRPQAQNLLDMCYAICRKFYLREEVQGRWQPGARDYVTSALCAARIPTASTPQKPCWDPPKMDILEVLTAQHAFVKSRGQQEVQGHTGLAGGSGAHVDRQ